MELQTITNVEDFIINLLAGKKYIKKLYDGIEKAIDHRAQGKQFYLIFAFPEYGTKQYPALELVEIYNSIYTTSLTNLFQDMNLDNVIRILFKVMQPIEKLYEVDGRAVELNSNGRRLFYTFTNPFRGFVHLDQDSIVLTGDQLINFSEEADHRRFINFLFPIKNS